jgi:exodeoxyribonuclease VII small subunit
VAQFEEGAKLLKICQKELKQAELKIQKFDITNDTRSDFDEE